ncbi:MAG: hypothetical protein ACYCYP_13780 [Leptospirales bacterium]
MKQGLLGKAEEDFSSRSSPDVERKKSTVAVTALERELAGFVWMIGCQDMGRPVTLQKETIGETD